MFLLFLSGCVFCFQLFYLIRVVVWAHHNEHAKSYRNSLLSSKGIFMPLLRSEFKLIWQIWHFECFQEILRDLSLNLIQNLFRAQTIIQLTVETAKSTSEKKVRRGVLNIFTLLFLNKNHQYYVLILFSLDI